jgi:hypothetical protein
MATGRIVVDLGPDEQARLSAESRRRGVGADAVIADLVRTLPEPDATQKTLEALPRLRASRAETPEIGDADIEAALAASRAEFERRAVPDLDD